MEASEKLTPDGAGKAHNEMLDFNLAKTFEVAQECIKTLTKSYISHIIFLSITAILLWGYDIDNRINIPILSLSIDKRSASIATLIFSIISLYWFTLTQLYHDLVSIRAKELYHERYGLDGLGWYMLHPSPLVTYSNLTVGLIFTKKPLLLIPAIFFAAINITFALITYLVLPSLFIWQIGNGFNVDTTTKVLMSIGAILILLPTLLLRYFTITEKTRKDLLKVMGLRNRKWLTFAADLEDRRKCIEHYGSTCVICNFSFERVYGESGEKLVHIHQVKPMSEVSNNEKLDPISHLRPLCPNCHAVLHKSNSHLTIDAVKEKLQRQLS